MQILGKRSKVLLIAVAIILLVTVGISFAIWDTSAVKATNGELSSYANAKVGDIIEFGRYYQTLEKDENGEYIKTPIEWIVVDKDERTGQLTLMSKYILACGSYFGNNYDNGSGYSWHYNKGALEIGGIAHNQAYVDSTVRAFLNNLERLDIGGDLFDTTLGYIPSGIDSTKDNYDATNADKFLKGTGLLSSVGFSNQKYWTNLESDSEGHSPLLGTPGIITRHDSNELYFQRPISRDEYKNRPVTRGFLEEAFSNEQIKMIVPKPIAGYIGHRWPDDEHNIATKSYVEGSVDKVWLPSVTELNIIDGVDWNGHLNDSWTNPSDEIGSETFDYFRNYMNYINPATKTKNNTLAEALISVRTEIATNGMIGNFSIPIYDKGTTIAKTAISTEFNTSDSYWTRSPATAWCTHVRTVTDEGKFFAVNTQHSYIGVRPCIILKY